MPDRGLLSATSIEDVAFHAAGPLVVPGAAWLQVTFEVDREAALSLLPEEAGRPIPPYGRLLIAVSPETSFALLSVGARYRLMPRNVLVEAVSPPDDGRVAATFGNGHRRGAVSLHREGPNVTAEIAGTDGPLARVALQDLYAIEPTMLRWDAFVAMAREDGAAVIAEVTPAHETPAAFLSKSARIEVDSALERASPWRKLRSLGIISACYAEGTINFSVPVVQQTWP